MKQPADQLNDPALLGVIHRAGGEWRVVVIRTDGHVPSLVEARVVGGEDTAGLIAALGEHRPGRVLNVLPAARVICRSCPLPDADEEHLAQALALQAEAQRLHGTPDHRLGMAVLDGAFGENTRTGLIVSWPLSSDADLPTLPMPLTNTSEVAALAALISAERPAEPLLSVDRASGSIALALSHANGVLFRGTHEAAAETGQWLKQVQRMGTESALASGHAPAFSEGLLDQLTPQLAALGHDAAGVWLPDTIAASAAKSVTGVPTDDAWMVRYGIALGAALAATGRLEGLCELEEHKAAESPSLPDRMVSALSTPRTAVAVVVVCLLLLGMVPVAASGLRLAILQLRHSDLSERKSEVDSIKAQLAMFDALEERSWSMTKVLSDIMCATPEGIEIESIRVNAAEGGFSMKGLAKEHKSRSGDALIQQMQTDLNESRIFEKVSPNWDSPNAFGHYEFSIGAKVVRPHARPEYAVEKDFGHWTLASRRDGDPPPESSSGRPQLDDEATTNDAPPDGAITMAEPDPEIPVSTGSGDEPSAPRRTTHGPGLDGTTGEGTTGKTALDDTAIVNVPETLTQGQIEVMSKSEVLGKMKEISAARSVARRAGNDELEARLHKEFQMLKEHLRSAE